MTDVLEPFRGSYVYPYLPRDMLYMDWRGPRILEELKTMNSDVIALQVRLERHNDN